MSELGALSLEEWLRQNEFSGIEFRSFGGERHVCLQGALPVWQLIQVTRAHAMDTAQTVAHFGWPVRRVQPAFQYYAAYPDAIDEAIAASVEQTPEHLRKILPQLEVFVVPVSKPTKEIS